MKYIFLSFLFISCAKISYMTEQGLGQVALEWNGKNNAEVLSDKNVEEKYKQKIRLIEKAKKYFYNYYGLESNSIYSQTTFLDQKAVSYLVIHSPIDKIQAMESCFPIAGCFPYQGFFSEKSALEFQKQKKDLGYQTFIRPVYAYSTLNHPLIPFSDNILSSFFYFKNEQLVNLIFHELVHTVVFVKNEIEFNENLAQFISDSMMDEYIGGKQKYIEKRKSKNKKREILNQAVVGLSKELNALYKKRDNTPENILQNFHRNTFVPVIKKVCKVSSITNCWPLKEKWNNARFAAFRTYEAKQNEIEEIFKDSGLSLKDFLLSVIKFEDDFDHDKKFIEYLKEKGK